MTAPSPSAPPPRSTLRVALCQLNLRVGALAHNVDAMAAAHRRAEDAGADVIVFPELAICGYPPEDLLLRPGFVEDSQSALEELARRTAGHATAVVGWVDGHRVPGADPHDPFDGPWNAAAVLRGGSIVGSYHKQALPNYGVFDEKRYFDPGPAGQPLFDVGGVRVGLTVCEDAWLPGGPVLESARSGAAMVLNLNASPFHRGKHEERLEMLRARAIEARVPIVYLNLVGGQDELVFDGGSMVVAADGRLLASAARFAVDEVLVDVDVAPAAGPRAGDGAAERRASGNRPGAAADEAPDEPAPVAASQGGVEADPLGEVWDALVLGVRDYVAKNGFGDVVVGLSGGVDSSIVATIAVDALGADRVHGVLMPSRYSSDHSVSDAEQMCALQGIEHRTIPIEAAHAAMTGLLEPSFGGPGPGLTEENLQSRLRGVLLMALSNGFGWLVLTTGNKSETAVGYSTLYGDTAGGLAVIKDVPKTLVYELCEWRNALDDGPRIPTTVLTKAPSAELRPDQRDDQSLPPYEVLDPIIAAYVDRDLTVAQIVAEGHDRATVERIAGLVDRAEYKRRQAPPGLRISEKAFGRDRRIPITNGYGAPVDGQTSGS